MVISSAALALAPKCPFCFLAYFGVFGVATASGVAYREWLPHLTAIWLAVTVGVLALRSGGQRRYGPALLGIFAGVAIFAGKFMFNEQTLVHVGIAALLAAAVWRVWFQTSSTELCQQCERPFPRAKELDTKRATESSSELPTWGGH